MMYSSGSKDYTQSDLDTYLESTVYGGFSTDIKNALVNMNAQYGNSSDSTWNIQRHVIAPSIVELGVKGGEYGTQLGEIYPIFSPAANVNEKSVYKTPSGDRSVYYWTRSVHNNLGTQYILYISPWGDCGNAPGTDNMYPVACIRFAKA